VKIKFLRVGIAGPFLLEPEMIKIETERLILRQITVDDWCDLQRIAGNDDVAPMTARLKSPWPEADVKAWISDRCVSSDMGAFLAICLRDGTLVGSIGTGVDTDRQAFLGYFVEKTHWGQGIVSEAIPAILAYTFKNYVLDAVTASCFTDNPASMRVLDKMGFEKYSEELGSSAARLEPAPLFLYRLTRTKFESLS
jgi:RimJ/RimL family protein N-acetyltransferase